MSTCKICFHGEIRKILYGYPLLSGAMFFGFFFIFDEKIEENRITLSSVATTYLRCSFQPQTNKKKKKKKEKKEIYIFVISLQKHMIHNTQKRTFMQFADNADPDQTIYMKCQAFYLGKKKEKKKLKKLILSAEIFTRSTNC